MNLFLTPAIFLFLFYFVFISNVKSLQTVQQLEDEAMVAFAKGRTFFDEFCATQWLTIDRYNDNLAQKYETFLGVLYFIKTNWQCEKVVDKLVKEETNSDDDVNDVKECGIYRKHVIILYEYLFREYARQSVKAADPDLAEQIPIVEQPIVKFAYHERGWGVLYRNAGTLIDLMQSLCQIWRFFFDQSYRRTFKSRSVCWLAYHRIQKPSFVNQESLVKKYGVELDKLNRTEFLYNTKNLKISANSNFDNSYLRHRKIFDENMAKFLEKVETNAKQSLTESKGVIEHLLEMPFYHILQAINDNAFLSFVKDKSKFENSCNKFGPNYLLKYATFKLAKRNGKLTFEETKKYLAKHFEAFLGIMFLVGDKWKCANSEFYLDECVKYRKYFDILHEYLLQEYIDGAQNSKELSQFSVVRPNFQLGSENKIDSLIDVLNGLVHAAAFFADSEYAKEYNSKFEQFTEKWPEPKLQNANEFKLAEETFGQKNAENVSRRKETDAINSLAEFRQKFDKILCDQQLSGQFVENESIWNWLSAAKNNTKLDDVMLLTFLKDRTEFEQLCKKLETQKLLKNIELVAQRRGNGVYDIGGTVEYLAQKYSAYFGAVSMMRDKWQCDEIEQEKRQKECERFKKYLTILYKHLFNVYIEVSDPELAQQIAAVRPNFQIANSKMAATIVDVLDSLCQIWAFYFGTKNGEKNENKLENLFKNSFELKLLNEKELENEKPTFGQKIEEIVDQMNIPEGFKQIIKGTKTNGEKGKSEFEEREGHFGTNESRIKSLREQFEEKMSEMTKDRKI